jgi:hypothetical protein
MGEKVNKKIVKEIREQMVRYHRLIIPEAKPKMTKAPSSKEVKKSAKDLRKLYEKIDNHKEMLEFMQSFRVLPP